MNHKIVAQYNVRHQHTPMRFALVFLLLGLLVVGCERHDAKMREQICGTWNGGMITFFQMVAGISRMRALFPMSH
jgi:hypothetical protein